MDGAMQQLGLEFFTLLYIPKHAQPPMCASIDSLAGIPSDKLNH
jgi:hypothetical protein